MGIFLLIFSIFPCLSPLHANEVGLNDFRISQMLPDGVESFFAHNADIAHNTSNGDYLVVWRGNTPSTEIENWAQRYDKDGNAIGGTIRITAFAPDGFNSCRNVFIGDCPAYYAHKPAVAYNSDLDEYLVVYAGRQTNMHNPNHLWGRRIRFDPVDGTPIVGSQYIVSDMAGTGDYLNISSINPDLAYNPVQKKYLVVFSMDISNSEQSTRLNIKGRVLDNDGTPMGGSHFAIGTHRALGGSGNAKVAYNANDDQYLVVWEFWDSVTTPGVSNDREIYGRLVNGDGSLISQTDIRISHTLPDNHNLYYAIKPNLAYNAQQNNYLVVWLAAQLDWEIFGQFVSVNGQEIGSDFQISEMGPDGDRNYIATEPNIAYNNQNNQFLVVWSGEDLSATITGDDQEIFGQVLSATGVKMGTPEFRISDMGQDRDTGARANSPAAMFNPDSGEYLVVWDGRQLLSGPDYEREIYGQRLELSPTASGPQITNISPANGLISGGYQVTISGLGFLPNATVHIGSNLAAIDSNSPQQIVVTVPAGSEGANDVVVTNPDSGTATLSNGFHYTNPPPTLTSVTPPHGPTVGGTVITIRGTGFLNNPPPTIEFGYAAGTYAEATNVNFISSTELEVTIPPYTPAQVDIRVTNRDTAFAFLPNSFWFLQHFTVRSVSPNSGPAIGGTPVSIIGEFLIPETEVYFGNQMATNVTYVSGFELTVMTPAGTPGLTDVSVRSVGRPDVQITNGYEYLPPPTLGEPFRVSNMEPDGSTSYTGKNSAVAYNSQDDEYLVVWRGERQGRPGYEIYGQRLDSAGNEIGELNFQISDMDQPTNISHKAHSPAVVYNSHRNEYFVAWAGIDDKGIDDNGSGGTISEIFGQRLGANGTLLESTDIQISQTGFGGIGTPPAPGLAYNSVNDQYLVVWSNQNEIYGQRIEGSNGNPIPDDNDFRISEMGDNDADGFNAFAPAVAHHPVANRYFVVWQGDDNTGTLVNDEYEIYGQILNSRGEERMADDFRISRMGPDGNRAYEAAMPAVTANPNNDEFLVTWQGDDNTGSLRNQEFEIYGRRINANAQMMSNQFRISQMGPDGGTSFRAIDSKVIYDSSDNEYMVVWQGQIDLPSSEQHDYEIFGQRLSAAGVEVGQNDFQISDAGPSNAPSWGVFNPAIALNTNSGNVFVSWFGEDDIPNLANNEHEVYGVLLDYVGVPPPPPPPTITSVTPNNGSQQGGTRIRIIGTGFVNTPVVMIGNTTVAVQDFSSTELQVDTPADSAGQVSVTVTNPDGYSFTLDDAFTYNGPPTITSVTPNNGPQQGETTIRIIGTGFVNTPSLPVVMIGNNTVPVQDFSSTELQVDTPAHSAGQVDVTVTNADGLSDTLQNAFTYNEAPTITSITPTHGPESGGTLIRITGTGFSNTPSSPTVVLGTNQHSNVNYISSTELEIITVSHVPGLVDLSVTNADLQSVTLQNAFTYNAGPTITTISPNSGPVGGGTDVNIAGTNLGNGTQVFFGGVLSPVITFDSDTQQLTAQTPAGNAGPRNVLVRNPDGQEFRLVGGFTFIPPPTLTQVTPNSGSISGGEFIVINGSNFISTPTVTVGGTPSPQVTFQNANQITALTPPHAVGQVDIVVTNDDGQIDTGINIFTYVDNPPPPVPAPVITNITPNSGPTSVQTNVTITGLNFISTPSVTINGNAATHETFVSATEITATFPMGVAGPHDVILTNPDNQSATLVNGYTYIPPPSISQIDPISGPTSGGTSVIITGSNFISNPPLPVVTFGGVEATNVAVVGGTIISFNTPPGTAGVVDVVVTNSDGQSDLLAGGFTYTSPPGSLPAPGLISVTPFEGPLDGGTPITIQGTNFQDGATVSIDGNPATSVAFMDATRLTATTPVGTSTGPKTVVVTNPDLQTATLPNGFRYLDPATDPSPSPIENTKTAFIPTTGGTINFNPAPGPVVVDVPPSAFPTDINMTLQPLQSAPCLDSATPQLNGIGIGLDVTITESIQPNRKVTLIISYRDGDVLTESNEGKLVIARCDEDRRVWIPLESTPNPAENRVHAETNHFSFFQLMVLNPVNNVGLARSNPNPFMPNQHAYTTFSQLPPSARIQIFSKKGALVKDLVADSFGDAQWDGRNNSGSTVASGIYIVFAEGNGSTKRFKIAVIR